MTTSPISPVEAEATGQPFIVTSYKGREYKLPTDVDNWPLDLIAVTVGTTKDDQLVVDHPRLASALQRLLGDQWTDFLRSFPLRRDLLPASQQFAAAAGFDGKGRDLAFGALPRLLATLEHWRDAVEATLSDLGIDYRDRWRFDDHGQRRLTLRQIHVRLSFLRPDSALGIAQNDGRMPHQATDLLLMDLIEVLTGKPHPSRPLTPGQLKERTDAKKKAASVPNAVADYRARSESRKQKALDIARANAQTGKAAHAIQEQQDRA